MAEKIKIIEKYLLCFLNNLSSRKKEGQHLFKTIGKSTWQNIIMLLVAKLTKRKYSSEVQSQ